MWFFKRTPVMTWFLFHVWAACGCWLLKLKSVFITARWKHNPGTEFPLWPQCGTLMCLFVRSLTMWSNEPRGREIISKQMFYLQLYVTFLDVYTVSKETKTFLGFYSLDLYVSWQQIKPADLSQIWSASLLSFPVCPIQMFATLLSVGLPTEARSANS